MAKPSIRATSNGQNTASFSISCTHPTGLTVGDLMVLFVGKTSGSSVTITAPSGWTTLTALSVASDTVNQRAFWKIAASGDVSAGSTTVSFSGSTTHSAFGMYAVTNFISANPVAEHEGDTTNDTTISGTLNYTTSLTPDVIESLVISSYYFSINTNITSVVTSTSFSITPSQSLTENIDIGTYVGAGQNSYSLHTASAEYDSKTEITSRQIVFTLPGHSGGSLNRRLTGIALVINAPQSDTGDVGFLPVTPVLHNQNAISSSTATISRIEIEPQLRSVSGKSSNDGTQWVNEPRVETNWTNEQI